MISDDGCALHASCLSCPLPRCAYEEEGGMKRRRQGQRDGEVHRLRRQGEKIGQLARRFRVSERTIYRILRRNQG